MAIRSYSVPLPGVPGKLYEQYHNNSTNSSKVNGKLLLTAHTHSFTHNRVTMFTNVGNGAYTCQGAEANPTFSFTTAMDNEVLAKFYGKLNSGSASLGVSLASWGQARSMIVSRLRKIDQIFARVQRRRNRRRRGRYNSRQLASDFLEGEFGWVPLLQDIYSIAVSAFGNAIPRKWIKATSKFTMCTVTDTGPSSKPRNVTTRTGWGRITCAAGVDIANPNLWIMNRLGLINPAVVAWDLVPWSFVVNMFVNVNQILSSFTATVGLQLSNYSTTRSDSVLQEQSAYTRISSQEAYYNHSNVIGKHRSRTGGSPPIPSLQFRLPNVNFELMAIASALVRQRVGGMR